MSRLNYACRKMINIWNQHRLKNKDFSVFSNNCNGACICHDLGLQFHSPFVNLFLSAEDYIKFLGDPQGYLDETLAFIEHPNVDYPVAKLKDITLYFVHYQTPEEAEAAWERRKKRINWDNLFVLMSDQDGCTDEILQRFDNLPYKNKAVFIHLPKPDFHSAVYIPGFEAEEAVGNCDAFVNGYSGRKYFDAFDYVKWFNEGK